VTFGCAEPRPAPLTPGRRGAGKGAATQLATSIKAWQWEKWCQQISRFPDAMMACSFSICSAETDANML
jgi:hypothetical protein